MGDWLTSNQTSPSTPAAGYSDTFVDSTTKKLATIDDAGARHGSPLSKNFSTASTTVNAADTYIGGSGILIPSWGMQAGDLYEWTLTATKTAAGTAQAIFTVRTGSNQSTADTSRLALTATTAQTAAVSSGIITVAVLVRNVSASGVLVGGVGVQSNNAGLGSGISGVASSFDNSAMAGLYIDLTINSGASGVWTVEACFAKLTA